MLKSPFSIIFHAWPCLKTWGIPLKFVILWDDDQNLVPRNPDTIPMSSKKWVSLES